MASTRWYGGERIKEKRKKIRGMAQGRSNLDVNPDCLYNDEREIRAETKKERKEKEKGKTKEKGKKEGDRWQKREKRTLGAKRSENVRPKFGLRNSKHADLPS